MRGLDSYVPSQDKNRKFFDGTRLGQIATLTTLPQFSYDRLVRRSSTIDAVWLNERRMPHSFFEVEHTTDIQNSLLKFVDLQDFNVKMYVVADIKRKAEFEHKLSFSAFKDLREGKRVKFMSYTNLIELYEEDMRRSTLDLII